MVTFLQCSHSTKEECSVCGKITAIGYQWALIGEWGVGCYTHSLWGMTNHLTLKTQSLKSNR